MRKKLLLPLTGLTLALLCIFRAVCADLDVDELIADRLEAQEIAPLGQNGGIAADADVVLDGVLDVAGEGAFLDGIGFLAPRKGVPMVPFVGKPGSPPSPFAPAWWAARGVIDPSAAPNDFAAATQGQVKWIASRAAAELAQSWVGASPAISSLVAGFTLTGNDLPVTLGQLKTAAKPFWDRIIAVGCASGYPWPSSTTDDDYALANVGQVKACFAFDPSLWMPPVPDMPDFAALVDCGDNFTLLSSPNAPYASAKAVGATLWDRTALFSDGTAVQWQRQPYSYHEDVVAFTGVEAMCAGGGQTLLMGYGGYALGIVNELSSYSYTGRIYYEGYLGWDIIQAACGRSHATGVSRDGSVVNAGAFADSMGYAELNLSYWQSYPYGGICPDTAIGPFASFIYPAAAENPPYPAASVAAAPNAAFALGYDGVPKAWGFPDPYAGITDIPYDLKDVVKVTGGLYHGAALLADGTVRVWGSNTYVPPGLSNVVDIVCTDGETVALLKGRASAVVLWSSWWGGADTIQMPPGSVIASIAASGDMAWGITTDGNAVDLKSGGYILLGGNKWQAKQFGVCSDGDRIALLGIKPAYFNGWRDTYFGEGDTTPPSQLADLFRCWLWWDDWFGGDIPDSLTHQMFTHWQWWNTWFGDTSPSDFQSILQSDFSGNGAINFIEMQTGGNPLFSVTTASSADGRDSFSWTPMDGATDYTITVYSYWGTLFTTNVTETALSLTDGLAGYGYTVSVTANGPGIDPGRFTATNEYVYRPTGPGMTAIKLTDPFSISLPPGNSNIFSRTFTVNRAKGWQQYFISMWENGGFVSHCVEGMRLEWSDDKGKKDTIALTNHWNDSIRLPVSEGAESLTLTLVAESVHTISWEPLYLLAWSPPVTFDESFCIPFDLPDGGKALAAVAEGGTANLGFTIDTSGRPCYTPPEPDEIADICGFFIEDPAGLNLPHAPNQLPTGGSVGLEPGVYDLTALRFIPEPGFNVPPLTGPPPPAPPKVPPSSGASPTDAPLDKLCVIDPYVGGGLDIWDGFPLDDCEGLAYWKNWRKDFWAPVLLVSLSPSRRGADALAGIFTAYINGITCDYASPCYYGTIPLWEGEGKDFPVSIKAGGKTIWETPVTGWKYLEREHDGNGYYAGDPGGGCCSGCGGSDCGDGGAALNSVRFRIPLGSPASGMVSGFLGFELKEIAPVTGDLFRIISRPGDVAVTTNGTAVTIACTANRGRTLTISNFVNSVEVWVADADGIHEHHWEITSVDARIRFQKINRHGLPMSDETYYCYQNLYPFGVNVWFRDDNLTGVTEMLWHPEEDTEVRKVYETGADWDTAWLSCVTNVYTTLGTGRSARRRVLERHEWDGPNGTLSTYSTYYTSIGSPFLHGALRSRYGDNTPWEFRAYDADGRETFRAVQLNGSPAPGFLATGGATPTDWQSLTAALGASDATITKYGYTGNDPNDSRYLSDARSPRIISTHVLQGGSYALASGEALTYTHATHSDDLPTLTVKATRGNPGTAEQIVTASVSYSADSLAVPEPLRGLPLREEYADGTVQEWIYELGDYNPATRAFTSGGTEGFLRSATLTSLNPALGLSAAVAPQVIAVEVTDAAFGRALLSETYLAGPAGLSLNGAAPLSWESRIYDPKGRVRFTERPDGSTSTNHYSCCRLLEATGLDGAKTLRSAATGYDHLYHAMEEVSLGVLPGATGHRVTQAFSDALGRVTNTTVFASALPPGAYSNQLQAVTGPALTTVTEYPYTSSSLRVTTAPSGLQTTNIASHTQESVLTVTHAPGVITQTVSWRNGPSTTERAWDNKWTRDTRETAWDANGLRVDIQSREDSDINGLIVTSVTRYDALGRVSTVETPLGTSSNIYAHGTTLLLATVLTGDPSAPPLPPVETRHLYASDGSQAGTAAHGVTNLTLTAYEETGNAWWRVTASTASSAAGPLSAAVTKERLTGLSHALRSETVTGHISYSALLTPASALWTTNTTAYDPSTHTLTATAASADAPGRISVTQSRYGYLLDASTLDTSAPQTPLSTTHYQYDGLARQSSTSTSSSAGVVHNAFSYDALSRLSEISTLTTSSLLLTTYSYDPLGRLTEITEGGATPSPASRVTHRAYDALGNLTAEWGSAYPVTYVYDTAGRRTSMSTTRDDGLTWDTTHWAYDPTTGLLLAKTNANGTAVATYAYDGLGRVSTRTGGRGITTAYAYDAMGNLASKTYSDATPNVAFTYDPFGRMTSAVSSASTVTYVYDGALLASETQNGKTITRSYDGFGRPASLNVATASLPLELAYSYDPHGRLAEISTPTTSSLLLTTYSYDALNRVTGRATASPPSLLTASHTRDALGNTLSVSNRWNATTVSAFAYGYDALNRRASRLDSGTALNTFAYNARSELTNAVLAEYPYAYTYGHDSIGNILSGTEGGPDDGFWCEVNALNQVTDYWVFGYYGDPYYETWEYKLAFPSYDADGNMTLDNRGYYSWDAENRLICITNGSSVITYTYDHLGRRTGKRIVFRLDGSTTSVTAYAYDGWNMVAETITSRPSSPWESTSTTTHVWGLDLSGTPQGAGGVGGLLATVRSGVAYLPCYDANGNVTEYVNDNSGAVAARCRYDAYGYTGGAPNFPFGFSTKYRDGETWFLYYTGRYYDPDRRRWLSTDPIEERGGLNLYGFCANDPINYVDYLGLTKYWDNYPNYDNYAWTAVWDKVGGGLQWLHYTLPKAYSNSCALRVSISIVNSGHTISAGSDRSVNNNYTAGYDVTYIGRTIRKGDLLNAEKPGARYVLAAASVSKMLSETLKGKSKMIKWKTRDDANGLKKAIEKCDKEAFFVANGHVGMIKAGYSDPYFPHSDQGEIWIIEE